MIASRSISCIGSNGGITNLGPAVCALWKSSGRQARRQDVTAAKQHGPLDNALKFAYVSGPRMANQAQCSLRRDVSNIFVVLFVEAFKKAFGNEDHIIEPFPQWWYFDLDRADPEVKILPQDTFKSNAEVSRFVADTRRKLTSISFSSPRRRSLRSCNTRSSLVWRCAGISAISSRSSVPSAAGFDQPSLIAVRPGECAFLVTEQL